MRAHTWRLHCRKAGLAAAAVSTIEQEYADALISEREAILVGEVMLNA
jgi:hypothetical protein